MLEHRLKTPTSTSACCPPRSEKPEKLSAWLGHQEILNYRKPITVELNLSGAFIVIKIAIRRIHYFGSKYPKI